MDEMFKVIGGYEGLNEDTIEIINACRKIKNGKRFLKLSYDEYDAFKEMVRKYIGTYFNEENKHIELVEGKDGDQFLFRQAIIMLGNINDEF